MYYFFVHSVTCHITAHHICARIRLAAYLIASGSSVTGSTTAAGVQLSLNATCALSMAYAPVINNNIDTLVRAAQGRRN